MAMKPIEILINAKDNASSAIAGLRGKLSDFGDMASGLAGRLAAVFAIGSMARAAAEMETLKAGLLAVSGSAEKAAEGMEFVRRMATTAGVDVADAGRAFLSLAAATKGTAVEGEATQQVFEAVTVSMAKAGKSSAETVNALGALGQMAGKGTVQMEELRGQLGEALPGALNAAAKGLGVTTQDLIKLVENGEIAASDLFPALTKGLNELYGGAPAAQTLSQELANLKNAFSEMASNLGDAGGLDALKTGAEVAQAAIVYLDDTLITAGKTIGVLAAAVATLNFSGISQAFADIEAESRDKLLKAAQHNSVLRASIEVGGTEAVKAALAQQQLATETEKSGAAAAAASPTWIKLASDYGKVLVAVREQIAQAEKSTIARDAEGKAAVALAQAFGTEAEQRKAAASATQANADAQVQLAQLKATELEVMKAELTSLQALAAEQGKLDEQKTKQLQELEKQIGLRQQDADKTAAQAQASRLMAAQAKAEAEAYQDNSKRVNELRDAYENARAKVEALRAAKAANKATTEQVTQAELDAGRAALLYRDALQDQLKAIDARGRAQRADLDVQAAGVQLALEQQRTILEVARARGDETGAMRAQEQIRRLEIQLLELSAKAKYAEADAAIAATQAKKAELVASGEYTGVKKLEIDAAIKAAEVKRLEGQIAQETANRLRQLAAAQGDLKGKTEEATGSLLKQVGALERLGEGVQRVGEGFRNKDGFTSDAKGNVQQQFVWSRSSIIDYLKQAGLDEMLAERLSKQFANADGSVDYEASSAQTKWGGKHSTLAEALGKMAAYYKYDQSGKHEAAQMLDYERANAGQRQPVPTAAPGGGGVGGSGRDSGVGVTRVIQLRLNSGQSFNVPTTGEGENSLGGFMQALARARAVSSVR